MGIKTVPQPPYSPDLAPCDFWLFPKLRGFRYETIEEMKEGVTEIIDTLTQEDFHGAFQNLLELYNKCIVAGEDYFAGDSSFMFVLSIKVPIRKKYGNLFNDPRIPGHHRKCLVSSAFFILGRLRCQPTNLTLPSRYFLGKVPWGKTISLIITTWCEQKRKPRKQGRFIHVKRGYFEK